MCTLHAITHRKCSKGPYLIFLFSFFIKCQWVMPDVSLTGEDVNPNAARTDEKKSSSLTKCQKILFFVFKLFTNVSEKGKKKKKRKKKNRFMLYRGSDALVFFCFFLECRSGWSRSLRNWNGECWNSWKGTKTRAGRKEKEDPGEKKTWKGHKKWVCWVSCGCVSWLKNQNVTSSKADATSQPFAAGWQQTVDSVLWIAEFIFLPRHVLACCLHQVLEK